MNAITKAPDYYGPRGWRHESARLRKAAERQDADVMLMRTLAATRGATPPEIQRAVLALEGGAA